METWSDTIYGAAGKAWFTVEIWSDILSLYLGSEGAAFGYTSIGGSAWGIDNIVSGSIFTCNSSRQLTSITVALKKSGASNSKVRCAVYQHSDLKLIGVTQERTISLTTSFVWYVFNFTTQPDLIKNTVYILTVWGDNLGSYLTYTAYDGGAADQGHGKSVTYTGTFPDPFPADYYHNTNKISIYANYDFWRIVETWTSTLNVTSVYWRDVEEWNCTLSSDVSNWFPQNVFYQYTNETDTYSGQFLSTAIADRIGDWTTFTYGFMYEFPEGSYDRMLNCTYPINQTYVNVLAFPYNVTVPVEQVGIFDYNDTHRIIHLNETVIDAYGNIFRLITEREYGYVDVETWESTIEGHKLGWIVVEVWDDTLSIAPTEEEREEYEALKQIEFALLIGGIVGVSMFILAPYMFVRKLQAGEINAAFEYGAVLLIMGFGLMMLWLI